MKKILLLGLVLMFSFAGFSQKIQLKNSGGDALKVVNIDRNNFSVSMSMQSLTFSSQTTKNGNFVKLSNNNLIRSYNVGNPELPVYSRLIEVPQDATVKLTVVSYDEEIIDLNKNGISQKITPAQPSLRKDIDPIDAPFYYNENVYQTDAFYNNGQIAVYENAGQMRDARLGNIQIRPFEYNPVTNQLKVYNNLVVKIEFVNANWSKTDQIKQKYANSFFSLPQSSVVHQIATSQKELIQNLPMTYVIVSDPAFETALQPFVEWKKQKGFTVIEAYTDDANVGTTVASIKTYLKNLYENPPAGQNPPSFILVVGDIEQVPATHHTEVDDSPYSDLDLAEYTGDYLPEVFYGRWSAEDATTVENIVYKTIRYEKLQMADLSYLHETFLIAGNDEGNEDTWGGGAIYYADHNYFNAAHNIYSHTFLQSTIETWSGGNSQAHDSIIADINNGVAWANYTAHCSPDGWADPSFSQSDLNNNITNNDKYGVWIGNCCQSNKFDENEAFAELAIRKQNAGVIGYIGGSQFTYWDEDYFWGVGVASESSTPSYDNSSEGCYDAMFHDKTNEVNDLSSWFNTNDGVIRSGCLAVEASSSPRKPYYWVIYQLAGDPSIVPYIGTPQDLTVTLNPDMLLIGSSSVDISSEPYTYVTFTQDDAQIATVITDADGSATATFSIALTGSEVTIVAYCQNHKPVIETKQPIAASEPYVLVSAYTPDTVNYNTSVKIDASFKNVADAGHDVTGAVATISTTDPLITIVDSVANIGNITGGQTVDVNDAFEIYYFNCIEDQHVVDFTITITGNDAKYTWTSKKSVVVNAPIIQSEINKINDSDGLMFLSGSVANVSNNSSYTYNVSVISSGGNDDGLFDANENVILSFLIKNIGHAAIRNTYGHLSTTSPYVTIANPDIFISQLSDNDTLLADFNLSISADAPIGTMADFSFTIGNVHYNDSINVSLPIGLIVDNFETGDLSAYNWVTGGDATATVTTAGPYEGNYCVELTDPGDDNSTTLSININGISAGQKMSFYYKVSSEKNYDKFTFNVNGTAVLTESGEKDWTQYEYTFATAGDYAIKFDFTRDCCTDGGDNTAWIDYVVFPSAPTKTRNTRAITITGIVPSWTTLTDNGDGTAVISGTSPSYNTNNDVILYASNGVDTIVQKFTIHVGVTSIFTKDNTIRFYPNPVTDYLTIKLDNPQDANVVILSSDGKIVVNQSITGNETKIDLSNLAKGVYILNLNINGEILQNKIIIK